MAKIGYARVSTDDQNRDLQRDALDKAGCGEIYQEKASGPVGRVKFLHLWPGQTPPGRTSGL